MFEVDPNLWLQSFATPWFTWLMRAVSALGYEWFYVAVVIVAGFSLRLRPMLGVMLALVLAGTCTYAAKDGLRLPRPVQVDARVLDEGQPNRQWHVEHGGAVSFASLPASAAIAAERAARDPDYGFISGHVASATAMCVALWLFFGVRSRWLRVALVAWPLLMAMSRLYLGRHFLGDAVGGALVGTGAAFAAHWLWEADGGRPRALALLAIALCAASLVFPPLHPATLGQLLGLSATTWLLARHGFPADHAAWPLRLARVAMAFALYASTRLLVQAVADWAGWSKSSPMSIPLAALATTVVLYGTVLLARRLGCYRAAEAPAGTLDSGAGA
jgi:membrane-associated phospholipid phosphatase